MTEGDTGCGVPPEVAQPQDGLASPPIQKRPATSQAYLIATACLAGSLVSAGLAVADIADYPNGVGYLAILGAVTGAVGGFTAAVRNQEKPPGWAYRINIVAAWLALISFAILLLFLGGRYGWARGNNM
jgi:hypothetical protein